MKLGRALFAFLACPGIVAGLLPALIVGKAVSGKLGTVAGASVLICGCVLLLWCVRDFFVSGKGTLAPWDPPRHLVIVGLYRYMRNPMYVAVLTIVAGWGILYAAPSMALYVLILAVVFHFRVTKYEEPWLHRQFGVEWEAYAASVSRWLPKVWRKAR